MIKNFNEFLNENKNSNIVVKLYCNFSIRKDIKTYKSKIYRVFIPEEIRKKYGNSVVLSKTTYGYLIRRADIDDINIQSIKDNRLTINPKYVEESDLGDYELEEIDSDSFELIKI